MASPSPPEPKRVLIINSFGGAAPPFTIHATSFESEMVANMGEGVAFDEVPLDMARFGDLEMQEAMVEYLQKRQTEWKPDLIVAIASPALAFVANHYDRLFPNTPILGVAANQRFLPQGEWEKNVVYVSHQIDVAGFLEDIMQVAPQTKNIEVVLGATALEQAWRHTMERRRSRSPSGFGSPITTIFPLTKCWNGSRTFRPIATFFSFSCCGMSAASP